MFFGILSQSSSVPNYILKITHLLLLILNRPVSHRLTPLLHGLVPMYLPLRPTHFCGMGITGSPVSPQHRSNSSISSRIPWISSWDFLNSDNCRGFVKWSPIIFPIGQCFKVMPPIAIRSAPECFFVLGDRLVPMFLQCNRAKVVLIHYVLISSETLCLNKVLRPEEFC